MSSLRFSPSVFSLSLSLWLSRLALLSLYSLSLFASSRLRDGCAASQRKKISSFSHRTEVFFLSFQHRGERGEKPRNAAFSPFSLLSPSLPLPPSYPCFRIRRLHVS